MNDKINRHMCRRYFMMDNQSRERYIQITSHKRTARQRSPKGNCTMRFCTSQACLRSDGFTCGNILNRNMSIIGFLCMIARYIDIIKVICLIFFRLKPCKTKVSQDTTELWIQENHACSQRNYSRIYFVYETIKYLIIKN